MIIELVILNNGTQFGLPVFEIPALHAHPFIFSTFLFKINNSI